MTLAEQRKIPKHDVLGNEPVGYSEKYNARTYGVVGQITTNRLLVNYELDFIKVALDHIEKSEPKYMLRNIEIAREKLQILSETFERILNDYGDTDPRHERS